MTLVTNSFEGGTGTGSTSISSANSGGASGTAFDTVSIGAGGTCVYDQTHVAHGGWAAKLATAAANSTGLLWNTVIGAQTQIWWRGYYYFTATPTANSRVFTVLNTTGTGLVRVLINTSGQIVVQDAAGAAITGMTSSASIPIGSWFRLEGMAIMSATVGQAEVKLFQTMDSATPDETDTSAASQNTLSGTVKTYAFGPNAGVANVGPYWLDDAGVSTVAYLGPSLVSSTDSGSGSDVFQSIVPQDLETGAGAEATSIVADIFSSEAAASAEALTLTASLSSPDSSAGAEAAQTVPQASDAGSGTDSQVSPVVQSAETAGGAEGAVQILLSSDDSSSSADGPGQSVSASLSSGDVGSGDELTVSVLLQVQETASGTENSAQGPASAEAGAGLDTDQADARLPASDTGIATEVSFISASALGSDITAGTEGASLTVELGSTDTGASGESVPFIRAGSADTGLSAEQSQTVVSVSSADSAGLLEVSSQVMVRVADQSVSAEQLELLLTALDLLGGADSEYWSGPLSDTDNSFSAQDSQTPLASVSVLVEAPVLTPPQPSIEVAVASAPVTVTVTDPPWEALYGVP